MARFTLPADWDHMDVISSCFPTTLESRECQLDADAWVSGIVDNPRPAVGSPLSKNPVSPTFVIPASQGEITGNDRTENGLSFLDSIQDVTSKDQMGLGTTPFDSRQPFPSPADIANSPISYFTFSPKNEIKIETPSPAAILPQFSPPPSATSATDFLSSTSPQPSPQQPTCAEWLENLIANTPLTFDDSFVSADVMSAFDRSLNTTSLDVSQSKTSTKVERQVTQVLITDQELMSLDTKTLNQRLKNIDEAQKKHYKQRRRTLKNRNYAQHCRTKKQLHQTETEKENEQLKEKNEFLEKQCEMYRKQLQRAKAILATVFPTK